jgi:hypothetical protein
MKIYELTTNVSDTLSIRETLEPIDTYLSQISSLHFIPVNAQVWRMIRDEGLEHEQNAPSPKQWVMATLRISDEDVISLRKFTDDALEKFNLFDIRLKELYRGRIIDLIDYDAGIVRLVKTV